MNEMYGKIKNILNAVKKFFPFNNEVKEKLNDYDAEEDERQRKKDEKIAATTMNEGKPDKVLGIKRGVVRGIVFFFVTVFLVALVYAMSDDIDSKKEDFSVKGDNEIAKVKNRNETIPNDYQTFIAYNNKKASELQNQQQPVPTQEQPAVKVEETTQTPIIPQQSSYPVLPVSSALERAATTTVPTQPVVEKKDDEQKNDMYRSPINFSSFGSSGASETKDSQNDVQGSKNSAAQTLSASAKTQYHEANDSTISVGTIIPVRLMTGINTSISGQVVALILSDVYDSATGTRLIIPQGSKLFGSYESEGANNGRIPLTFNQLALPDGGVWELGEESMMAMDGAGYSGVKGKIHHHTAQKIGGGVFGSAIAALGSLAAGNTSSQNTYTAGQLATKGALANIINSTSEMFKDSAKIKSTVTIAPGYEFNIYVKENISFGR